MVKKLFFSLMFIVLLAGSVSAYGNVALGGTPEYNYYGEHLDTYGIPAYINDNDATLNYVGVGGDSGFYGYIIGYNSIVNLAQPTNIDKIEYARSYPRMNSDAGSVETISIYSGGTWTVVSAYSLSGLSNVPITKQINGNWQNVEKVKLNVQFMGCSQDPKSCSRNYHRLYELRSFGTYCGDGTCDATENCGNCVSDCGCTSPQTCQGGVCVCTPQTCEDLGRDCGTWDDGCGGTVDCGVCPDLTGAYWANMREQPITQANLSDRVQLRVAGTGMQDKQIGYTIYKDVWYWFDSKVAETDTVGFTTWRPTELGTYYFEAEVDGDVQTSGNLEVLPMQNHLPYAEIIAPKLGEIYYKNEVINFDGEAYDEDDEFSVLWNFGDGDTSAEIDTTHSYTTTGQKTISLVVTDERGGVAEDKVSILIVDPNSDGEYLFAHIDNPEWGQSFYGDTVSFNASSTYSVETTGCPSCVFTCTSGGCPVNTREDLSGDVIGAGTCPECRGNYSLFKNYWQFNDGTFYNKTGIGGILFDWTFFIMGKHTAVLTVSKNPESTTGVEFYNYFDNPYCYRDDNGETYWYLPDGSVSESINNCYRSDGIPTTGCCPSGYACDEGTGFCEVLEGIPGCAQYDSGTCGTNNFPAEDELDPILNENGESCGMATEYGDNCWNLVQCMCVFDGDCGAVSEHLICYNDNCYDLASFPGDPQTVCAATEPPIGGQCSFSFSVTDECDTNGVIRRIWNALWTGGATQPDYCTNGEDQIPCKTAKLVFWGTIGTILAIFIIIVIYLILGKKKKKRKKK